MSLLGTIFLQRVLLFSARVLKWMDEIGSGAAAIEKVSAFFPSTFAPPCLLCKQDTCHDTEQCVIVVVVVLLETREREKVGRKFP